MDDNPESLACCFLPLLGCYQWIYSQVGAWWPTYSINTTPHYCVGVCLTFRIYPLTSSGRILTCRSLNLKVCHLSSGPHGKICVPLLIYRTIRRPTNICYTTEKKECHNATSALCHFWYWQEKRVDLFRITFILSELHATDGGFKLVIGLSPGYGACPPHPRHSRYSPPLLRPCCWRL